MNRSNEGRLGVSRRRALAGAGTAGLVALSGCLGSVRGSKGLESPEEVEDETLRGHDYGDDDDRSTQIAVSVYPDSASGGRYPLQLLLTPAEGLRVESLHYRLQTGLDAPWPTFHLERPASRFGALRFEEGDQPGETVLELPELDTPGGTVVFDLLADPRRDHDVDLRFHYEVELEAEGRLARDRTLDNTIRHTLPGRSALE